MKTHKSLTLALTLATASMVGMVPGQAGALEIGVEVPKGFKALQAGDWQKAHTIFVAVTGSLKEDEAKVRYGGKFGELFYFRGVCEQKLAASFKKKGDKTKSNEFYNKAVESFNASYRFPSDATKKNKFEKKCLLKKAQTLQSLNDFSGAILVFEKFGVERNPAVKVDLGMLNVSMAICYFKQEKPDLTKGIKSLETALKNKARWKTQDAAIVTAFQALTEASIKTKNEQALIDFINQNRAVIVLNPHQMVQFNPFFRSLGARAFSAGMVNAAFNIFALIPDSEIARSDLKRLRGILAGYPEASVKDGSEVIVKAKLDKAYNQLKLPKNAGDPPEVYSLSALAYVHESNGYTRGALAAYENLELYFSKSAKREEHLYNLVRTASIVGDVPKAVKYGQVFLKEFPTSKHSALASTMMLSNLFNQSKYARVEEVAGGLLGRLKKPSTSHDYCLHVLGGSKFYQGKYKEAKPLLAEHSELYPESVSKIAGAYYEASNLGRLKLWSEAAAKLDSFIEAYPSVTENIYLSHALYDRARISYADADYDTTRKLIKRIMLDFSEASIGDSAQVLSGDVELKSKELGLAKAAYLKAYEQAKSHGNVAVSAESLYKLVKLLGSEKINNKPNETIKEAAPYYDLFWKDHQDSPYKTQLAYLGLPSLVAAGRSDEALNNLKSAIGDLSKKENAFGLEKAISYYTKYFVQSALAGGKDDVAATDALASEYHSFNTVAEDDIRTRAILEIEIIKMYEKGLSAATKTKNAELALKNKGRIGAAFKKLKTDFPLEKLTVTSLVKIADYLRTKSASPRQALPYYEERLKRTDRNGLGDVQFGIADVYSKAGNAAELDKAIAMMGKILTAQADNKNVCDKATGVIVVVYAKQKNWKKVIEEASAYLKNKSNKQTRTGVTQLLAQAYGELEMYKKCIATNMGLYGANTSRWDISVPAIDRATELMWQNGEAVDGKSKQQLAYDFGYKYIKSSRAAFEEHKLDMSPEVREAWLRIAKRVSTWENDHSDKIDVQSEEGSSN